MVPIRLALYLPVEVTWVHPKLCQVIAVQCCCKKQASITACIARQHSTAQL